MNLKIASYFKVVSHHSIHTQTKQEAGRTAIYSVIFCALDPYYNTIKLDFLVFDGFFRLYFAHRGHKRSCTFLNRDPICSDRMVFETIKVMTQLQVCLSLVMFPYCKKCEEFVLTVLYNYHGNKKINK